jgi:hypothetical protein
MDIFQLNYQFLFNDATIKTERIYSYVVGSISQEGITFSVTEMKNKKIFHKMNLDDLIMALTDPNTKITNISKSQNKKSNVIYCELMDDRNGACIKYIYSKRRLYSIIIEYPISE